MTQWFKRTFTRSGGGGSSSGDNRMGSLTERESYTPLRGDHEHDHDDEDEVPEAEENDGEDYEMIKRNADHED
jgi:hypothetical protein